MPENIKTYYTYNQPKPVFLTKISANIEIMQHLAVVKS